MSEVIRHAAVKSVDGWIFLGKSHAECFGKAHYIGIKMSKKADDQGFVTSEGRFVSRGEAAVIAIDADQVDRDIKILFSEDLWSRQEGGFHNYDEIKGYVLSHECEDCGKGMIPSLVVPGEYDCHHCADGDM